MGQQQRTALGSLFDMDDYKHIEVGCSQGKILYVRSAMS